MPNLSNNESAENIFIIHNGFKTKMTYEQIFDFNSFTDLKFVSYKFTANFFNDTVKKFQSVNFIIGKKNSDLEIFEDEKIKIYIANKENIHDNFFLLANEETKRYRVVIGSISTSPDDFANFRVDDSKELYDLYLQRFDFLLSHTEIFYDYYD